MCSCCESHSLLSLERAQETQGLTPLGASPGSQGCCLLLTNVPSLLGFRYNSAKKDNDFIYHEAVPALDTLQSVKGEDGLCPLLPAPDGRGGGHMVTRGESMGLWALGPLGLRAVMPCSLGICQE